MTLNDALGKGSKLLATAGILMAPLAAQADSISYTYAELGYQSMTGDGSFTGFLVQGSYQVNDQFYVAGGYDELEDSGISQSLLSIRGGMRHAWSSQIDLYSEVGLAQAKVDASFSYDDGWGNTTTMSASASDTGLQLEGGGRMLVTEQFEAGAYLRHVNVGDTKETFLGAKGTYYFTDKIGAHANVSRLFDASEFLMQVGIRFNF